MEAGDGLKGVGCGGFIVCGRVLRGGGDDGDVAGEDDGGADGGGGEVLLEPGELIGVDEGVVVAGGGDLDGVEEDEVVTLLVKGAICPGVESLLKGFFAVEGGGGGGGGSEGATLVAGSRPKMSWLPMTWWMGMPSRDCSVFW